RPRRAPGCQRPRRPGPLSRGSRRGPQNLGADPDREIAARSFSHPGSLKPMRQLLVRTCLVSALALLAALPGGAADPARPNGLAKKSDKVVVIVPLIGGAEAEKLGEDLRAGKFSDFETTQRLSPVFDLKITAVAEPRIVDVVRGTYLATQVRAQRD